ncbi:MAG TPA: type II toxin-antitoxin system HicB family antitoxin [bacterium]|nr:type II toxin-antitoxin system HicB family antitoxin [bacterium]
MKEINYIVWQEGKYWVSKCLNVEISSFGETIQESISNLKEAIELYFEDTKNEFNPINSILIGKDIVNA